MRIIMTLYDYRIQTRVHSDFGYQGGYTQPSPVFSVFSGFFNALMMRMTSAYNPYVNTYSSNPFCTPLGTTGIFYNQFSMPTFSNTPYKPSLSTPTYTGGTPSYQGFNYGVGDYFVPSINRNNSAFMNNSFSLSNSYVGGYVPPATSTSTVSAASTVSSTNTTYGNKDLNFWKSLGYNEEKGKALLENAKKSKYRGARHQCVAVVREAINDTYYGGQLHYARFGKACNIGDQFLSGDSHFKKIIPDWNATKNDFPPGAIIVYRGDNGNGGYVRGDDRGHGELAYGDGSGKGLSNYDLEIKPQFIKEVWIPV